MKVEVIGNISITVIIVVDVVLIVAVIIWESGDRIPRWFPR